jgi:hypothetical protein
MLERAASTESVLRVTFRSGATVTGTVHKRGEGFQVNATPVPPANVSRIEAKLGAPDPVMNGLAVGAGIGGLTGLVLAASLAGYSDSPRPSALPAVLIGGGIGAAAGAVIDYTVVRRAWKVLWP